LTIVIYGVADCGKDQENAFNTAPPQFRHRTENHGKTNPADNRNEVFVTLHAG